MPKTNCFSVRPGSLFNYRGVTYKVLENDTLTCTLHAKEVDKIRPKRIRIGYHPGQEIFLRWVPHKLRD